MGCPFENRNTQTITDEFSKILKSSRRQPIKLESGRGREFCTSTFRNFLKFKNIHRYSKFTHKKPSIVERQVRTLRNLLEKVVFEKNDDWLFELPSEIKKYNNTIHSSTKITPSQASMKIKEKDVHFKLQDGRQKRTPKFKLRDLVRTAVFKKVFLRGIQQIGLINYIQ